MNDIALAFDIGGTSTKYAYVSSKGEIMKKSSFRTSEMYTIEELLTEMYSAIESALKDGIQQVGIASLGIFNKSGMCLGGVENLPFLENKNLVERIKSKYPEVTCHIINDGVAAAMGEYWLGEGRGCENFICMTLGTGIGGAVVINGKPLLGSHYQSGEIGYSNYRSKDDYLELHYSTKGVLREAASRLGVEKVRGIEFSDKVKQGDTVCEELFHEWMDALASMLANSILLLDPEKLIIGGGISGEKEWICNGLDAKLQKYLPEGFNNIVVSTAENGNDAGILGAAEPYFNI